MGLNWISKVCTSNIWSQTDCHSYFQTNVCTVHLHVPVYSVSVYEHLHEDSPLSHRSPGSGTCSSQPALCSPQTSPQPVGPPHQGSSPDASSYSRSLTDGPPASSGGAGNMEHIQHYYIHPFLQQPVQMWLVTTVLSLTGVVPGSVIMSFGMRTWTTCDGRWPSPTGTALVYCLKLGRPCLRTVKVWLVRTIAEVWRTMISFRSFSCTVCKGSIKFCLTFMSRESFTSAICLRASPISTRAQPVETWTSSTSSFW